MVRPLPNTSHQWAAGVPGEREASICEMCPPGTRPNAEHQRCVAIPLKQMTPQQPLAVAVLIICCLGIVTCFLVAGVFVHFGHTPLIKASGRETSFFLLAGILLSYLLPIALVQPPSPLVCGLMRVAPGLCLTVCYAAILAKTNRIARIFQLSASGALGAKKPKFISPLSQIYFCSILVAVELIILVIWIVMEPPDSNIVADNVSRNDLICRGRDHVDALVGLLCPIVLLILTTMYAFRVRKTPDGFNEARCLGFVNYANCVVIVTSLPIIFIFNDLILSALTLCFPLVTSATADLLGLFLPKIYTIFRRPDKNTREAVMSRTRSQSQVSLPGATANVTAHNSANSHANLAETFGEFLLFLFLVLSSNFLHPKLA